MFDNLRLDPVVLKELREMSIYEERDAIMFVEQYKYLTRDEILERLIELAPKLAFASVDTIQRDSIYFKVESKYNVLISKLSDNDVEIVLDYYSDVDVDFLLIDPVFNLKNVSVVYVTPVNYLELAGHAQFSYDPLAVFRRYLFEAIQLGATDIHFDVLHANGKATYPVAFRVGGRYIRKEVIPVDAELNKSMIAALVAKKTSANELDLLSANGVTTSVNNALEGVDLRLSAGQAVDGYHYVARIQKKATVSMQIDELGFNDEVLDAIGRVSNKRNGLTLITGEVRSGKNTTAFAMANKMVHDEVKIVSYESPIEVLMPFTQVDYKSDESILLNSIRLAKKQDVNIAFINEIPDKQVAFAAQDLVNSSVHVITTLHIHRLWHLPYKLREYYGDNYKDVLSQINIVINQKMFPKACPHCKHQVLTEAVEDRHIQEYLVKHDIKTVWKNTGCDYCQGTGKILNSNQPYAEFVVFTDDLVSKLLSCDAPYQMETVLREAVKGHSLEKYMLEGVKAGKLNYNDLITIM